MKLINWSKISILLFFVIFQIILFKFWPSEIKSKTGIFFIIYQLIFLSCTLFVIIRGYSALVNTLMLLLFLNLFTDTNSFFSKYNFLSHFKTLEPNSYHRLEIVGNVMPGFKGVNNLSTDSKGFRTTKKINYDDPSKYRIFSVGGSSTAQVYVDDKETWSAYLENLLHTKFDEGIETINTGVSGLRAVNHLATLQYTEQFNPDLYLFLLGPNDWNNHIISSFPEIKRTLLYYSLFKIKKFIFDKNESVSKDKKNEVEKVDGVHYFIKQNSLEKKDKRAFNPTDVKNHYRKIMIKIAKKCNDNNYECMVITSPNAYSEKLSEELKRRLWMTPPNEDYTLDLKSLIHIVNLYNNWLKVFASDNDLFFCDLASKIEPSIIFIYDDLHFNEIGSKKAAEEIAKCINQQLP